ncbi:MAG: glucosamine-6-phosphate deaminase [Acidobacteria bacterium]|nr:MAG: glucosamine-6-phosphate deaminase [Acidobacteriota bacterium]
MQIVIHPTARGAAEAVAWFLADCLYEDPGLVLGLPTGRTPVAMYRELVRLHRRGRADFSRATTFNLDEFVGVAPDHPGSYRQFMTRHLFADVNLDPTQTHVPNGDAPSPRAEAARYDAEIAAAGGLDIAVVGIGANGHIGFNEPARTLPSHTSVVRLKPSSRRSNAKSFGGSTRRVPARAISMGMGTILSARHVILLATGSEKAEIVRKALNGPITTMVPASLLQGHPKALVVLDRAAARRLTS